MIDIRYLKLFLTLFFATTVDELKPIQQVGVIVHCVGLSIWVLHVSMLLFINRDGEVLVLWVVRYIDIIIKGILPFLEMSIVRVEMHSSATVKKSSAFITMDEHFIIFVSSKEWFRGGLPSGAVFVAL